MIHAFATRPPVVGRRCANAVNASSRAEHGLLRANAVIMRSLERTLFGKSLSLDTST
jgi:hypothetical protein